MKRTAAALLAAVLAASAAACGGETAAPSGDAPAVETASVQDTEAAGAETEAEYVPDGLPSGLDLGGGTVTFLYRSEVSEEFFADSANGEIVNDAVYKSVLDTEERLNVDINAVTRPGHTTDVRQEYMNHIKNSILSGDSLYDWVDLMIGNSPVMMSDGIFLDLAKNSYIDLSRPWYLKDMADTVSIDGQLYFIAGDISLGYMRCAFGMYFNKQIAEDYGIESLYALVDGGAWTLDNLMRVSAQASEDINGDGKYDIGDKLGFVNHDNNHPKGFWASTDIKLYERDESGEWKFGFGTERTAGVCDKLYNLFFTNPGSYFSGVTNAVPEQQEHYNQVSAKYASGEIFIITAELDDSVAQLRDMKDPYGILPYPKYDESQAAYYSSSRNTHNAFSMPVTCSDPERAGAVMEALSCAKYNYVLPTYFEVALKSKYARDDDSSRMYDIIRDSMILDFGYTYGNAIGSPEGVFSDSYKKEGSLISNVAKKQKSLEKALEKYLEKVRNNCG